MKLFTRFGAIALTFSSFSALAATQSIECKFTDTSNKDRVMVSLTSTQAGTFSYNASSDDGDASSAGKLNLRRIGTLSTGLAAFSAEVAIPDGGGSVTFTFEFPESFLMKAGTDLRSKLTTEIFGFRSLNAQTDRASSDTQNLICNSKLI